MFLTRAKAIQKHREMWEWITSETRKQKRRVKKTDYFEAHHIPKALRPDLDCFLCDYSGNTCDKCPLKWERGTCIHKDYKQKHDGLLVRWMHSENWRQAADYADAIATLPEKQDIK